MKTKVGILGSRNLCCKILEWVASQEIIDLVGVVAPPFKGWFKDEVKEVCNNLSIVNFESINQLLNTKPDIIFSVNYWKKIDIDIIRAVPQGIVNIHHSYLLKYKGRYSTSWAIVNARKLNYWLHGTTLHYIDEKLDEGKIIDSRSCVINEDDTSESLFEKVEILAFDMFKENFEKVILDKVNSFLKPDSETFFYDSDSNKNLEIPFGTPPEEVFDFVRAWSFKSRPKPFYLINGKKIYLSL